MKTLNDLKEQLTELEFSTLQMIVHCYNMHDNICYDDKLTKSEKGIFGSLVKKGFIYDSFEDMHHENGHSNSNFFPSNVVLDIYGIEHY
jgi:hypothetical protein